MKRILSSLAVLAAVVAATAADAQQPHPWQMTFQPAATDMMAQITWFEHYTLWFIVPITLLVLALLAYASSGSAPASTRRRRAPATIRGSRSPGRSDR